MRSIAIILVIFVSLLFQACTSRSSREDTGDSSNQAAELENPEPDSNRNQIDSSSDTSKTIVENIADRSDMSVLTSKIETTDLTASLTGPGPFTLLAPTDTAFSQAGIRVSKNRKPGPDKKMQGILGYHLVSGFYRTDDLTSGMELTTLEGRKIRVTVDNGVYRVNGVPITVKNIVAKNGVIHVIDQVLTPPDTAATAAPGKKP
ncbi:MAG TPA: fasciclin domain-containing protein [Sphingobacteriaceae bacterium]